MAEERYIVGWSRDLNLEALADTLRIAVCASGEIFNTCGKYPEAYMPVEVCISVCKLHPHEVNLQDGEEL